MTTQSPEVPKSKAFRIVALIISGVFIGGIIGFLLTPGSTRLLAELIGVHDENYDFWRQSDPQARAIDAISRAGTMVFGVVFAGIGAVIGGVVGAVVEAVIRSRTETTVDFAVQAEDQNYHQSTDFEVARIQEEIERLQGHVDDLQRRKRQ